MAYVKLDTIYRAVLGSIVPVSWLTQVNDNDAYLYGLWGTPAALTLGTSVALYGSNFSPAYALQQGSQVQVEGVFTATAAIAAGAVVATLPASVTKPTSIKPISGSTAANSYGRFDLEINGTIVTQQAIASGADFMLSGGYIVGV